jgi:hypothetical protein
MANPIPYQPQPAALGGTPTAPPNADADLAAAFTGAPVFQKPPDRYADDKKLLKFGEACKHEALQYRWVYERAWWRNILYLLGRQWIYYDISRGQWVDKRLAKWIPRPVTNKVAEVHQSIISVFEAVSLVTKVRPGGSNPKDISTAEICDKIEPLLVNEHQWGRSRRLMDFWLIATGNVFLHTWWDKFAEAGDVLVPFIECPGCGTVAAAIEAQETGYVCQNCGTPNAPTTPPPTAVDGAAPAPMPFSTGRGTTDVVSPFEIGVPAGYTDFRQVPWVLRMRWRSKEWYEKSYPDIAKTMQFSKGSDDRSMQLYRSIAGQSDIANSPFALMAGTDAEQGEGTTEYELNVKPNREYPQGLILRWAGKQVIRDEQQSLPGPLPYKTAKGNPLFPWVHIPYERFGGKIWGRSPHDLIIQKNDQINQIDSLTQLIIQRTANPIWLEPKGAEVQKFTGEPGLVVKYNPLIAGGSAKPERIEGANVPGSLIQIRGQLMSDIETLSGTYDVLKGSKPAGVEAFSAMQLLVERSQSRFGPVLAERGEGYRQWFLCALELERSFGSPDRFYTIMGPNGKWQIQHFKNADLAGDVEVVIEDGSQAPKTNLGMRAAIQQLQQLQMLNPQDSDQTFAIYKAFGQTQLIPQLDADVKSSLQEQDEFEQWAMSPAATPMPVQTIKTDPLTGQQSLAVENTYAEPPSLRAEKWHNHAVHLQEHRKWLLGDTGKRLITQQDHLRALVEAHLALHEMMMMQVAQGMPAFAEAPPVPSMPPGGAAPAPASGAGGARALLNSNAESGNPNDVPHAAGPQAPGQAPV